MFWLVVLSSVLIRVFLIFRNSIPFPQDMGRDLLWAKDIAFYHKPTLIGPAASIWGVYFGPLWFYFLSLPLAISGGNPFSAVWATMAAVIATPTLAYLLFKKHTGKLFAFVLAAVMFFSAHMIIISTYAFHANVLPLLTMLMIYFCFLATIKNPLFISLAFLAVSLMFHADPAPAAAFSFLPPAVFLAFGLYKKGKVILVVLGSIILYAMPFLPQVLFEIRNNFVETKALVSYFQGENPSLSGQLPLFERIVNRLFIFFDFFKGGFGGESNVLSLVVISIIIFGLFRFVKSKKDKNLEILLKINLLALFLVFAIFTFIITVEVKNWYLSGVSVLIAFLISFAFFAFKKRRLILVFLLAMHVALNVFSLVATDKIIRSKVDPANLTNQLRAIDEIYKDAKGTEFSVYTYSPPIYDLSYQYLFWWLGVKMQRGLPTDFSYLPNQPEYVRNKNLYVQKNEQASNIFLIIEQGVENEFYTSSDWFRNFQNYQMIWEKNINGAIILQKRMRDY